MALISSAWTTATTEATRPNRCKLCGESFEPRGAGSKQKVFCNRNCMLAWHHTTEIREQAREINLGKYEVNCARCGIQFSTSGRQDERRVFCSKPCAWRAGNSNLYFRKKESDPLWNRKKSLRKHGLTVDTYDQMLAEQGGVCAICKSDRTDFRIDHDHDTGRVRGILCNGCNAGIGMFLESIDSLESAVAYLLGAKWH